MEIIQEKINFVQEKLIQAKNYLKDYENSKNKKDLLALERIIEQIVETSIKINKLILKTFNIQPLSYKESFLKLEKLNIFETDFLELLANTALFRNELAHDYMSTSNFYSLENIKKIISNYPKYLVKIIEYIEK